MWTKEKLKERFSFCEDQHVMLFTSYKAFGEVKGGPQTVVDAFSEMAHTVLFPNFNFQSWTEQHYWDYYETPSKMGIITEFARKQFPRTFHPVYPFAVSGPEAKEYQRRDDEMAFGHGSPFAKFYHEDGLIVSVGLDDFTKTFTPVHYAEFLYGVDYRYEKSFHGIYRGYLNKPKLRTYSFLARCDDVINDPNPASRELMHYECGIIGGEYLIDTKTKKYPENDAWVLIAGMKKYVDAMQLIIKNHPEKLHRKVKRD